MKNIDAALVEPIYFDVSAWVGHIPFASWLVKTFKPSILVELGTYSGVSYLSFCQAVAANQLTTRCYAVDTWKGDTQSGYYGEQIYLKVRAAHDVYYSGFSDLLRMQFDEAVHRFADESVDLLHIDGLHTYEAVKHDFYTWLPKLSERAVVLFHDTDVVRDDFGVHQFWHEIAQQYPGFRFKHCNGLGVLLVGSNRHDELLRLVECDLLNPDLIEAQLLFQRLGARFEQRSDRQIVETKKNDEIVVLNNEINRLTEVAAQNSSLQFELSHLRTTADQLRVEVNRQSENTELAEQKYKKLQKEYDASLLKLQTIQISQERLDEQLRGEIDSKQFLQASLHGVSAHNQTLESKYDKYKKLWIVRMMKPLIKTEQAISSANRYRKGFQRLVKEQGSVGKAYQSCRRLYKETSDFKVVKRFLMERKHRELTLSELGDIESPKNGFVILATRHTYYIAQLISHCFKKVNIESEIIFDKPVSGYANKWHFVVCPQMFESLPAAYFAFQMEQSVSSRWFTQEYFERLNKAEFVFDYSLTNTTFLQEHGVPFKKLYYLPVDVLPTAADADVSDAGAFGYDVAFYGDVNSERRQVFLKKLRENFSVLVISEVFGEELYAQLQKAKVIVNVHYYENALLETTRIYECLSLNKVVVSEVGSDQSEHGDIEHVVDFVAIDDVDAMIGKVDRLLNDQSYFQSRVDAIRQRKTMPNKFEFYFNRFLLAQDLLDFDAFYELSADYIKPQNDFWCLSLAETTLRRKDFDKDNVHDIWVFPGLRHNIGWVGCGLSYKLMMRMAKDLNLPQVTICEDDVLFDEKFERRYSHIKQTLVKTYEPWDVFSGLIADLSKETEIFHSAIQSDEEAFYAINRLVSMVFNIYNKTSYQKIIDWDEKVHMPSNTIDRYIEQHDGIDGLIVSPFLVGHKEDVASTLWGFQNTQYKEMIEKSQILLNQMIDELSQRNSG